MVLVFPLMYIMCENRYLNMFCYVFCCLFGGIFMKSVYVPKSTEVKWEWSCFLSCIQPQYSDDISTHSRFEIFCIPFIYSNDMSKDNIKRMWHCESFWCVSIVPPMYESVCDRVNVTSVVNRFVDCVVDVRSAILMQVPLPESAASFWFYRTL